MEIKTSETVIVRRSEINMNPANPKRHTDERVDSQKRNIWRVGFLGGVIWNAVTGNLVDGHRRLMAMDRIKAYDGTPRTDYDIKVERVEMDDKTEKEQMTYMSVANTQPDLDLISRYAGDIDLTVVGFSPSEIRQLERYMEEDSEDMEELFDTDWNPNSGEDTPVTPVGGIFPIPPAQKKGDPHPSKSDHTLTQTDEEYLRRKEELLDGKRRNRENADRRAGELDAYITLSFSSYGSYAEFCRLVNAEVGDKFIKGEPVLTTMEKYLKKL